MITRILEQLHKLDDKYYFTLTTDNIKQLYQNYTLKYVQYLEQAD